MQRDTILKLADFASSVTVAEASDPIRASVTKVLIDSLGVASAGQHTDEYRDLEGVWPLTPGLSSVWGREADVDVVAATMLNAVALCMLELDEGNKFARGHPGAHVLPVALAEAERVGATGHAFLDAFLTGYEVAARVARAFRPAQGLHPHGNWGAVGAAAAVGRLHGFSAMQLAAAMDAAAGLALASPFASALNGSFVRNTWVGAAGVNGLTSARIAQAGLGTVDATGASTFGGLLGALDDAEIVNGLGQRWEITGGYFKRHSSCNYTHPPADAALEARQDPHFDADAVEHIAVDTHALAVPLAATEPRTRLAAMFSIPHVVAVALTYGRCRPAAFAVDALQDSAVVRLRERTTVQYDAEIDARRPAQRGARVRITLTDGQSITREVPNAIGDADHHPLSATQVDEKLMALIGDAQLSRVHAVVQSLHRDEPVRDALGRLP